MTPERIDELRSAAIGARERKVTVTLLPDELEALCALAKSAIPSGTVAEDESLIIMHVSHECADGRDKADCRGCQMSDAARRLALQAQSYREVRGMWLDAERESAESRRDRDTRLAMAGQHIADLETSLEDVRKDLEDSHRLRADLEGQVTRRETEIQELEERLKPSGQVAGDVELLKAAIVGRNYRPADASEALARLSAKAQGYEAALADNAALVNAATKASAELRHTYGHIALGQHINPDLVARAIRILETATAQPHPGAALLKDLAVAKAERDARERDLLLHFEAKNAALARVAALKAKVAHLSAAGQVLSAHVDRTSDSLNPNDTASLARDALERVFYWLAMGDEGPETELPADAAQAVMETKAGAGLLEQIRVAARALGGLREDDEAPIITPEARAVLAERRAERAERALRRAGFEDHGWEDWAPPVGAPEPYKTTVGHTVTGRELLWTMRDEFAKAALTGLLANNKRNGEFWLYAADAYAAADTMMKARAQPPPEDPPSVPYLKQHPHVFVPGEIAGGGCHWSADGEEGLCGYSSEEHEG